MNLRPRMTLANLLSSGRQLLILPALLCPALGLGLGADPDVLVGVNYFAGWWDTLPNKWHGKGWTATEPDWRPRFPERIPVLGCTNDQPTMDREIAAAAAHGVDFFSILWYFPQPGTKTVAQARLLNRGVENFLASPHAGLMKFMIEYCNAPDFCALTEAEWSECVATWLGAMKHPSYLRVDGRPVFKIHGSGQFLQNCGGDSERCRRWLDAFREAARQAGLGELLIGGGIQSRTQVKPGSAIARLFDFTATYMSIPPVQLRPEEYPFSILAQEARQARAEHARDPLPYLPYLAAGWNPRPWTHAKADENHRRFFAFPGRAEWTAELRAMKEDLARQPALGLPRRDGTRQPAFTIYAWNEFGEGGFVAPAGTEKNMKLEAIREVFPRPAKPALWAMYYAWYQKNPGPRGRPGMWTIEGTEKPRSKAVPLIGYYDSDDAGVVRWHIRLAKAAGIDAFLCSWWGGANVSGRAFEQTILPIAAEERFPVAICSELAQFHHDVDELARQTAEVLRRVKDNPAYLRVDGKPVIYLYQVPFDPKLTPATLTALVRGVESETGPVHWMMDKVQNPGNRGLVFPQEWLKLPDFSMIGFYGTFSIRRTWTYEDWAPQYARLVAQGHAAGKKVFLPAHPGLDNSGIQSPWFIIPRENGATLRGYLRAITDAGADAVLLTSFNEWPETTVVEPSSSWPDPYFYLRLLAEWKGIRFNPPALPQQP